MAQSVDEECGVCLDALTNPVALPCSHKFCSQCLDSWRSKYGAKGDPEEMGKKCPLCRKKIPPSKEMIMQLKFLRDHKKAMERNGGSLSEDYCETLLLIEELEQEIGDWTEAEAEALDYGEDNECLVLPASVVDAAINEDIQTVLDWIGPPPVDKNRINARNPDFANTTLVFYAVLTQNAGFLSIILQLGADVNALNAIGRTPLSLGRDPEDFQQARLLLEWGAKLDSQDQSRTKDVKDALEAGNVKLATLLTSDFGGRRCELVNYSTRPELNGKTCVVEKHLPDKDRYKIVFEGSGQKALVPPYNLKRRDRTPTDCGYYITFANGCFSRRDFASKEECQAYVAEVEAKHAAEQLDGLDISSSATAEGRRGKRVKKKKKGRK